MVGIIAPSIGDNLNPLPSPYGCGMINPLGWGSSHAPRCWSAFRIFYFLARSRYRAISSVPPRQAAAAKVLQNADWQPLEADNGAVYKLDMNSIKPGNGGAAQITVYADEGRSTDIAQNLKFLLFDCHGRFIDMNGPMSQSAYAPPKSVAGQIGAIACARAQAATAAINAESDRRGRSPEEYCKGFSSEACNRMKSTIDAKQTPPYCKPGFAVVGSGLSAEQLRICYVMD